MFLVGHYLWSEVSNKQFRRVDTPKDTFYLKLSPSLPTSSSLDRSLFRIVQRGLTLTRERSVSNGRTVPYYLMGETTVEVTQ